MPCKECNVSQPLCFLNVLTSSSLLGAEWAVYEIGDDSGNIVILRLKFI